jgi:EmrB/QacA subfamily drug resistance transporter
MIESSKHLKKQFFRIVICVVLATFMAKIDVYIVSISLPNIAKYYGTTLDAVSRIVLVFLLASTSTLLFFGKLGDRLGPKKILTAGYILFTFASFLCTLSPGINYLVFFRFIQGLGASMLVSSSYSIIPRFIPKEINGWAFGIVSMGAALGISIGAPLGGLIVKYFSWQWIFLINIPVGTLAVIIVAKAIPAGDKTQKTALEINDLDLPGTILSFIGISALLWAISIGDTAGWTSQKTLLLATCSMIALIAFYVWEKRASMPILDFQLFKDSRFLYTNISIFLGIALMGGNTLIMPFYLEYSLGLDPLISGLGLMSYSVAYIIISPCSGMLSDRIKPPVLSSIGIGFSAAASIVFSCLLGFHGIILSIIYLMSLGVSFGLYFPSTNKYIMSLPSSDKIGVASGIVNTIATIGLALGVVVFETIFSFYMPLHGSISQGFASIPGFGGSMISAYSHIYLAGGILCILSAIFSAINIRKKNKY